MSDREIVLAKWPDACAVTIMRSPDEKRVGMPVIESKWKNGDELGIGMIEEEAWSVAARRIREEENAK